MSEREVLKWDTFGSACKEIAQNVVDSGFVPDLVLCIARGGMGVGGTIAYAMGVKNCFAISVEYYTGVDERLEIPVILAPALDVNELKDLNVLVVDDVADTGNTLALVVKTCAEQVKEIRSAVLYKKSQSIIDPDYVWKYVEGWIVFPWSAEPGILESVKDA